MKIREFFEQIDWQRLQKQKAWLMGTGRTCEEANGLAGLLDHLMNAAVNDLGIAATKVFDDLNACPISTPDPNESDDCHDALLIALDAELWSTFGAYVPSDCAPEQGAMAIQEQGRDPNNYELMLLICNTPKGLVYERWNQGEDY